MSKKCTPLWLEAHFEVKSAKNCGVRSTFGRSDVVLRGRHKGLCTLSKVSKTKWFCTSFNYNHHYITLHSTALHYYDNYNYNYHQNYNYITLHYITLRNTSCITLHYTTLHYTTIHYNTLTTTTATTATTTTTTLR